MRSIKPSKRAQNRPFRKHLLSLEALETRAMPAVFTFAGFAFDDTNVPDKLSYLPTDAVLGGAKITSEPISATLATVAFPDAPAGFNPNQTVGTYFFPAAGARALNLPAGNDGTANRSGVLFEFSTAKSIPNGIGQDLLFYESGNKNQVDNISDPEPAMISAFVVDTGTWTDWYYRPAEAFGYYGGSDKIGAFATRYDFSDLGVSDGHLVTKIRLVNMTAADRMVSDTGVGIVIPEDNGATSTNVPTPGPLSSFTNFDSTSYDPDPLYLVSLQTLVPDTANLANVLVNQSVAPGAPLTAGTAATFTVTVSNAGPGDAKSVSFSGLIDAAYSGVTFTSDAQGGSSGNTAAGAGFPADTLDLPAGATVTYTFTGVIDPATTGTINSTFTAGLPQLPVVDINPADNTSNVDYAVQVVGDAAVTITSPALTAGASGKFEIVVTNAGPSTLTGVGIANVLPASFGGVTFTSTASGGASGNTNGAGLIADSLVLPPNSKVVYTVNGTVDPSANGPYSASASATVNGGQIDSNIANNKATANGQIARVADISVEVAGSPPAVFAGDNVTYTITVTNNGPSLAPGAVLTNNFSSSFSSITFTSTASGGATGNTTNGNGNLLETLTLPPGSKVVYTVTGAVSPVVTTPITNSASIAPDKTTSDPNLANNTSTATTDVLPAGDVGVTITASSLIAGGPGTYVITFTNSGPSTMTGVAVSNVLPTEFLNASYTSTATGGATGNTNGSGLIADSLTLPAGGTVTYTVSGTLSLSASGLVSASASAVVAADEKDLNPANNTATVSSTVIQSADLAVTIDGQPPSLFSGGIITYTITVTNNGPSVATDALVSDNFPSAFTSVSYTSVANGGATGNTADGAGDISDSLTLQPGASVVYTITAQLSNTATGTITNSASIAAPIGVLDPDLTNNNAVAQTTVIPAADLAVSISPGTLTANVGQPLIFTVVVTNSGPTPLTGVQLAGVLPEGLIDITYTSTSAGGASGNTANGTGVPGDLLDLPTGASVVYTITATPAPGSVGVHTISFSVAGPEDITDPDPLNNTATATLRVDAAQKVIYAVGTGYGVPGDVVVYNSDGTERFRFRPFENSFTAGVLVAIGDVNNDGFPDVVVGPAEGGGPRLFVRDGFTGDEMLNFFVYEPEMRNGIYVAVGDINGDGTTEIITGTGLGGGPRVTAVNPATGEVIRNFFAYEADFRGGVRVSAGDVDGDGIDEIITAAGDGGGPHVRIFNNDDSIRSEFFAGDSNDRSGIFIGVGDLTGSGLSDLVVGAGLGAEPYVLTYDARTNALITQFLAYEPSFTGGVRVATYVDSDAGEIQTRILTGAGIGGGPRAQDFSADGDDLRTNQFVIPSDFRGGVYVG